MYQEWARWSGSKINVYNFLEEHGTPSGLMFLAHIDKWSSFKNILFDNHIMAHMIQFFFEKSIKSALDYLLYQKNSSW